MKLYSRKLICLGLIGYTLLLTYWMIWGFGRRIHSEYMYNLKPFHTIRIFLRFRYFRSYTWIINLIGNIGVFVPFGILLPLSFRCKYFKSLGIFLSGLLVLETVQLLTRRGSFDIDDFLLNTIGFTIGYTLLKKWL